jgi:hypothetical protein
MRSVPVVALTALLVLSLTSSDAWAKGSTLRFERESYQPGDRAVAHAIVETWSGLSLLALDSATPVPYS